MWKNPLKSVLGSFCKMTSSVLKLLWLTATCNWAMANDSVSDYTRCVICCSKLSDKAFVTLTPKGLSTLKEYWSKRSDEKLAERLWLCGDLVTVHTDWRKKYTDQKRLSDTQGSQEDDICRKKVLRSSGAFDFKQQCFFCAETAV